MRIFLYLPLICLYVITTWCAPSSSSAVSSSVKLIFTISGKPIDLSFQDTPEDVSRMLIAYCTKMTGTHAPFLAHPHMRCWIDKFTQHTHPAVRANAIGTITKMLRINKEVNTDNLIEHDGRFLLEVALKEINSKERLLQASSFLLLTEVVTSLTHAITSSNKLTRLWGHYLLSEFAETSSQNQVLAGLRQTALSHQYTATLHKLLFYPRTLSNADLSTLHQAIQEDLGDANILIKKYAIELLTTLIEKEAITNIEAKVIESIILTSNLNTGLQPCCMELLNCVLQKAVIICENINTTRSNIKNYIKTTVMSDWYKQAHRTVQQQVNVMIAEYTEEKNKWEDLCKQGLRSNKDANNLLDQLFNKNTASFNIIQLNAAQQIILDYLTLYAASRELIRTAVQKRILSQSDLNELIVHTNNDSNLDWKKEYTHYLQSAVQSSNFLTLRIFFPTASPEVANNIIKLSLEGLAHTNPEQQSSAAAIIASAISKNQLQPNDFQHIQDAISLAITQKNIHALSAYLPLLAPANLDQVISIALAGLAHINPAEQSSAAAIIASAISKNQLQPNDFQHVQAAISLAITQKNIHALSAYLPLLAPANLDQVISIALEKFNSNDPNNLQAALNIFNFYYCRNLLPAEALCTIKTSFDTDIKTKNLTRLRAYLALNAQHTLANNTNLKKIMLLALEEFISDDPKHLQTASEIIVLGSSTGWMEKIENSFYSKISRIAKDNTGIIQEAAYTLMGAFLAEKYTK